MTDTPQLLLAHHLKALKLPTFLREYDKLARQCAAEGLDHIRFLLRLAELELIDRERRMVERRIKEAKFPAVKSLLQAKQSFLIASLQQFMDESRGGIEADRQPLLAGRETKPETNVRLAGAAVANCDDILPAGHILRAGELQHERFVERRNGGKVEAVQCCIARRIASVVVAQPCRICPITHPSNHAIRMHHQNPRLNT